MSLGGFECTRCGRMLMEPSSACIDSKGLIVCHRCINKLTSKPIVEIMEPLLLNAPKEPTDDLT